MFKHSKYSFKKSKNQKLTNSSLSSIFLLIIKYSRYSPKNCKENNIIIFSIFLLTDYQIFQIFSSLKKKQKTIEKYRQRIAKKKNNIIFFTDYQILQIFFSRKRVKSKRRSKNIKCKKKITSFSPFSSSITKYSKYSPPSKKKKKNENQKMIEKYRQRIGKKG